MASLQFRRIGRSDLPVVESHADLPGVLTLDDALWVATAAPVDTLRGGPALLAALDKDGDGRIRVDEVRAAVAWLLDALSDPSVIRDGADALPLSALAEAGEGARLREAARQALVLGDEDPSAGTVSLGLVQRVRKEEEARGLSAAGMVLPAAAQETGEGSEALQDLIAHVIEVTGGTAHPAGGTAVTAADLDRFLAEGTAWRDWHAAGHADPAVRPLGDATAAAAAAVDAVAAKIDQFFLLCDAVALDPALAGAARIQPEGADLLDPGQADALLSRAPLATPAADGVLRLDGPLNPAFRGRLENLRTRALAPLLGGEPTQLDRKAWKALQAALAPWREWRAAEPETKAGDRGIEALVAHLDPEEQHGDLHGDLRGLIAASEAAARVLADVKDVERLLLLQGGILPFLRSFLTMPDLYDTQARALYEQGALIMDGRVFDLAVRVTDLARAQKFGARSPMYIMYVELGAVAGKWTDTVAVPVTAGHAGHLVEGMYGVFLDVDGRQLHARVKQIAASPISIKEALLAPFRRISDALQKAADKAASAQTSAVDKGVAARADAAVDKAGTAPTQAVAQGEARAAAPAPAPAGGTAAPAPAEAGADKGIGGNLPLLLAGGGVALAAVGSTLTFAAQMLWQAAGSLAAGFLALPAVAALTGPAGLAVQLLAVPVAVAVVVLGLLLVPFLLYAIPVSIATWLRLRRRDMAALLEGSGWAINRRLRLTRSQARWYTRSPREDGEA